MDRTEIIDIIHSALKEKRFTDDRIVDASYDGDNKSASVILVTEVDGKHQEWIISSDSVRLLEDDRCENCNSVLDPDGMCLKCEAGGAPHD